MAEERQGISNRESAADEAKERREHPPRTEEAPPVEDVSGRQGEASLDEVGSYQTSHKAGSRSIAQKEERTRYPDRSMPASRKVGGAFGAEPREPDPDAGTADEPSED
jgi:hypothetical protein